MTANNHDMVKDNASKIMKISLNIMVTLSAIGLILITFFGKIRVVEIIANKILLLAVYVVALSPIIVIISLLIFYILQRKKAGIYLTSGLLGAIFIAISISLIHRF